MHIRTLHTTAELDDYDRWVRAHPQGTLWQSVAWKTYQERLGREVRIYAADSGERVESSMCFDATALVVIDRTTVGFSTWEIPRGPLMSGQWLAGSGQYAAFQQQIIDDAKHDKCFSIYLSPPTLLPTNHYPLTTSDRHIHPEATRVLDLTPSEQDILAQMHPKGRYNIGLAKKHDITVETCESHVSTGHEIDIFYELLQSTGSRDSFRISQKSHYERFLCDLDGSFLLIAKHHDTPIAGLLGAQWNGTAMYYYGASSYEHRNLMAPYLLQWEAMRRAKANGCTRYDLLGISPNNAPADDPWWGITDFKRKFGGTVVPYPPEQMLVLRPLVKRVLVWKRSTLG